MESRIPSDEIRQIAEDLIEQMPELEYIKNSSANIAYLMSDAEKKSGGKLVLGTCERVASKWFWIVPYEYLITLYLPNVERLNDEQMRALVLHELLHIDIEVDGNEEEYRIRPHDFEDFMIVINRFGLDWAREDVET